MEISPIMEIKKFKGSSLNLNWIFETIYEKAILIVLISLGFWKLIDLVMWVFKF